uniref:Uncharacterized protein n=1 Tax=viral metagenome TaxID=1070528 RepID=A0A6H1Z9P8_9ZZZZ
MDGTTLAWEVAELLNESSSSSFMESKVTYDALYEAATKTVARTNCITSTQSITTVADQRDYLLNADFLKMYLVDDQSRQFVKYTDGSSNDTFIYPVSYDSIILQNNEDSADIPSGFVVRDATAYSLLTGTTTSAGAATGGVCTLTDFTALFTTTNVVSVGDTVNNVTDGSHGVVVAVTSATALVTALFGGTANDWSDSDTYYIHRQRRMYLTLDPPPSTASETITVPYVQRPAPVYSAYYSYSIPYSLKKALVYYAAWVYKYRDRQPSFGNSWYQFWDAEVKQYGRELNTARNTKGFRVNLKKRAGGSGSYR